MKAIFRTNVSYHWVTYFAEKEYDIHPGVYSALSVHILTNETKEKNTEKKTPCKDCKGKKKKCKDC